MFYLKNKFRLPEPRGEERQRVSVSRNEVIQRGLQWLDEMGTGQICRICIEHGGSCCSGCIHLSDGIGCRRRNTSCTAWLCGFLKYVLHEADRLEQWDHYWKQVPGQDFRQDSTPASFQIEADAVFSTDELNQLFGALHDDLQRLSVRRSAEEHMITLREKLNGYIDQMTNPHSSPHRRTKAARKLKVMSLHFPALQAAVHEYRSKTKDGL